MAEASPGLDASPETLLQCLGAALAEAGVSLDGRPLAPELSLDHDLGVDSFQLMQVARHLEKAYAFRFSVADWVLAEEERDVPSYTVGGLLHFLRAALADAPSS